MSITTYVSRTRFETLDSTGAVVCTSFGARIYNDDGMAYANSLDSLEELLALDAGDLIEFLREESYDARDMIDLSFDLDTPIYVDDELYGEEPLDEDDELSSIPISDQQQTTKE